MNLSRRFDSQGGRIKRRLLPIGILILALFALPFILTGLQQSRQVREKAAGLANLATLTALADRETISLDETDPVFSVSVFLNTGGATVEAVDIILTFDTNALELVSLTPSQTSGFNSFLPLEIEGEGFDVTKVISQANSSGKVEFGATTFDLGDPNDPSDGGPGSSMTGSVSLASLQFRALSSGQTTIGFDFDPNREGTIEETQDSNVVQITTSGVVDDILNSVTPATVMVVEASCQKSIGDANCDGSVNLTDFSFWLSAYRKILNGQSVTEEEKAAVDFNYSGSGEHVVNLSDFIIWLETYRQSLGV